MGIANRLRRIVKSYASSAADSLQDEFQNLSRKYESGELSEHFKDRYEELRSELEKRTSTEFSHADAEEELNDYLHQEFERASRRRSKSTDKSYEAACRKLGVKPEDDLKTIEKAYKKELRQYHPDRFAGDPERMKHATTVTQMLTEAWQTIKTARKN